MFVGLMPKKKKRLNSASEVSRDKNSQMKYLHTWL